MNSAVQRAVGESAWKAAVDSLDGERGGEMGTEERGLEAKQAGNL